MNKKKLAAFYTPTHTVNYILDQLHTIRPLDATATILEPSGGDGIFVSCIRKNFPQVIPNHIDVRDINPKVKKNITSLGANFAVKDSLLQTRTIGHKRYSHIIGNPPYLDKQSDYIKKNKQFLHKYYKQIGVIDTYAMFIYMSSKLLQENGVLGCIVSDTFLTLGRHKKFRAFLLKNYTVHQITICPRKLFEGAAVNTCILIIQKKKSLPTHHIHINDCREKEVGDYNWDSYTHNQHATYNHPDHIILTNNDGHLISYLQTDDKMMDHLEWWLGMHTKDNNKYLAAIDYDGIQYGKRKTITKKITLDKVDGKKRKFYHKLGGDYKYYLPTEYAVKRDDISRQNYGIPSSGAVDNNRPWILISGVCNGLSARVSTPWAMRESNKAMCFFPKNPETYPPEYFIGLLNSASYGKILKLINHTYSLQIRDIKKLPMIHLAQADKQLLIQTVQSIIQQQKKDSTYDYQSEQHTIDTIVQKYVS